MKKATKPHGITESLYRKLMTCKPNIKIINCIFEKTCNKPVCDGDKCFKKNCREWPYSLDTGGYGMGRMWFKGGKRKSIGIHRLSHQVWIGPVTEGYDVMHLCNNPSCINPFHLKQGTRSENIKYSVECERFNRRCHHLDHGEVKEMRELYATGDVSQYELSAMYETPQPSISHILMGNMHPHAGGPLLATKRRMTPEEVIDIRQRVQWGERQVRLAEEYNVNKATINHIVHGRRHKNV